MNDRLTDSSSTSLACLLSTACCPRCPCCCCCTASFVLAVFAPCRLTRKKGSCSIWLLHLCHCQPLACLSFKTVLTQSTLTGRTCSSHSPCDSMLLSIILPVTLLVSQSCSL